MDASDSRFLIWLLQKKWQRLNDATRVFLKSAYKEYYFRCSDSIEFPTEIQSREFGYIPFGGGMVRHLSFRSQGEALAEFLRQSPSSIYCSNARYEFPTQPIEEKGWLGAELIFDIDATDIPTPCKRTHDVWYCERCHSSAKLPRPPKCPKCGGPTVELHITCQVCLGAAKEHTVRLEKLLTEDFGVQRQSIRTYFSGNRGYHLHIFDKRFEPLDHLARGEIADYVRGDSLPPIQTIASTLRRRPPGAAAQGEGWARRIMQFVDERSPNHEGTLRKLVFEAVASERALVDSLVTTDIHRVFRLAGTLHGNTGMAKMPVKSIDAFDPQEDPVILGSKLVKIKVDFYPKFKVKGSEYGPFRAEEAELPTFAAIPILTRGLGEVA